METPETRPQVIREYARPTRYALVEIAKLPDDEKRAVEAAKLKYNESVNEDFKAGACALAENGHFFAANNNIVGRGGHAESAALSGMYQTVEPSERIAKAVVLVASKPRVNILNDERRYSENDELEDIDWENVCGHCRKFINDYTAGNTEDVTIIVVLNNEQVVRTSLKSIYPFPHKVTRVPLAPIGLQPSDEWVAEQLKDYPEEIRTLKKFDFDNPRHEPHPDHPLHEKYDQPAE